MRTIEQPRAGTSAAEWSVWSTTARVVVTDPSALEPAMAIVKDVLAQVDRACSRFRQTSELRLVMQAGEPRTRVSPLLADLVRTALQAARETDGAVDPTIGNAIEALGYASDIGQVRLGEGPATITLVKRQTWREVSVEGSVLDLPPRMLLDLGATAKAYAADLAARLVWERVRVGVLVSLGGDIATAGPAPAGDWQIRVQDLLSDPECQIALPAGCAIATSSTRGRRWIAGGRAMHHIVDPWTYQPVPEIWKTASVVADSCVRANTLSTAALVWGLSAPGRLRGERLPTRLVAPSDDVLVLGGWPADSRLDRLGVQR